MRPPDLSPFPYLPLWSPEETQILRLSRTLFTDTGPVGVRTLWWGGKGVCVCVPGTGPRAVGSTDDTQSGPEAGRDRGEGLGNSLGKVFLPFAERVPVGRLCVRTEGPGEGTRGAGWEGWVHVPVSS